MELELTWIGKVAWGVIKEYVESNKSLQHSCLCSNAKFCYNCRVFINATCDWLNIQLKSYADEKYNYWWKNKQTKQFVLTWIYSMILQSCVSEPQLEFNVICIVIIQSKNTHCASGTWADNACLQYLMLHTLKYSWSWECIMKPG